MTAHQEMPVVRLTGSWPVGTAEEINDLLGEDLRISYDAQRYGVMPWADLPNIISAVAAAITVGLSLWDRWKMRPKQAAAKPSLESLRTAIKTRGLLNVEITSASVDPASDALLLELIERTSGTRFQFQSTIEAEEVQVSLLEG